MQFQIAFDCADPHRLNRYWSELLGYQREEDPDFVRRMVDEGQATEADTIEIDGVLTWRTAAACRDPEGKGPRMLFQHVPEPKSVKNRVHLDLHVPPEEGRLLVERAIALGGAQLWEGQEGPSKWITLGDPEGNEFCITI